MKSLVLLILSVSIISANNTYSYGNIDMHGGKKDSLIKKQNNFSSKFQNNSIFIKDKKSNKKIKKVKNKDGKKL